MSALPAFNGSQLIKALRRLGFEVMRVKGVIIFLDIPTAAAPLCRFIAAR